MEEGVPVLRITGEVESEVSLRQSDLAAFTDEEKISDIRQLGAKRTGSGVFLKAILHRAGLKPSAHFITFHSPTDDFMASVHLDRVIDAGVIVYSTDGKLMTAVNGGPYRFIIPEPELCGTDELDECVNVKYLEQITLSSERGRDTRPHDYAEHEKLHEHGTT